MFPTASASRSALAVLAASAAIAAVPAQAEDAPAPAPGRAEISPARSGPGLVQSGVATGVESPSADRPALQGPSPVLPERVRIAIGPQALSQGDSRYAARSDVAGTALIVSFSTSPPPEPRLAGSLPTFMPISGRLSGAFGWRTDPLHGSGRFHAGVDLAAPAGSPIRATSDGSVTSSGWAGGYGYMVVVSHGNGVETRYAHMSAVAVDVGRSVRQGDVIGLVGSTGRSTGPHVHYEVRIDGRAVDPLSRR